MSDAVQSTRSWGRWFAGVPALALATSLMIAYFRLTKLTANWSVSGHIAFRSVVVLFGMIGLAQFAAAWTTTRGTLAAPRFGRHRMVVPTEGIVYLAIMFVLFTGAMLTKQNTLLLVFAMMAGPFVINGWTTFGMLQATRVAREAPRRAMAGELFGVELTLKNRHPLLSMWMMSVRDEIAHVRETLSAEVLFARVAPRSNQSGHYHLRLVHRGRYRLGPVLVSSRFPLGLVERSRLFPASQDVLVYPRIGRLSPLWKRRFQGATELVARPQAHAGIFHDEFHRLREFRTGDNPRDIHWRSSARRGELILREYQQNRDFNLAVVLDLWRPAISAGVQERNAELVEKMLSFALTAIVEHGKECRDGTLSLVAAGATTFRWEGLGTSASLETLFDGLALFEPGDARETKALVDETLQLTSASTQVVLLTTRPAEASGFLDVIGHNPRVNTVRFVDAEDFNGVMLFEENETGVADVNPGPTSPRTDVRSKHLNSTKAEA